MRLRAKRNAYRTIRPRQRLITGTFGCAAGYAGNGSVPMSYDNDRERVIPAEQARQGQIVLRKRWQRIVFIGGFVAIFVIAVAVLIATKMHGGSVPT
jgi:hypothetical protein